MISSLCNSAWLMASLPAYRRFRYALRQPEVTQWRILRAYLHNNRNTVFGRRYGFDSIRSVQDFISRIPIQPYEGFSKYIERIKNGEPDVLARGAVRQLMPSSGSASARKLIPYNKNLRREFGRAIAPWIADLFIHRPALLNGKAYWSITPLHEPQQRILSKVPIGYDQDSAYLGDWARRLVEQVLAVNPAIVAVPDTHDFQYLTLLSLLRCRDLRLISVWHPSFLVLLLNHLSDYWDDLLRDIADGTASVPGGAKTHSGSTVTATAYKAFHAASDHRRSRELSQSGPDTLDAIWPKLTMLSCWGDGHAQQAAAELQGLFPQVEIQYKGLIATEAFISLPFMHDVDSGLRPLAICSHFFEFLATDGGVYQAHELQQGVEYEVVVTTGAGLYRYRTHDSICVDGFIGQTPCIRFTGKTDVVCDFYGEKIHDRFAAQLIEDLLSTLPGKVMFSMLAPDGLDAVSHYTLFMQADCPLTQDLALRLDTLLCENPHYALCRKLGQLERARIYSIDQSSHEAYILACQDEGKRLGDIKPVKLSKRCDWRGIFSGRYLDV